MKHAAFEELVTETANCFYGICENDNLREAAHIFVLEALEGCGIDVDDAPLYTTHEFDDTEEAYAACQVGEAETGDLLIIESMKIVGVAYCWPIAATIHTGELHRVAQHSTIQLVAAGDSMHTESISDQTALIHGYKAAQLEAAKRGWPIDPKQADNSIRDLEMRIQNIVTLLDSPSEAYDREAALSAKELMKERDALEKALCLQGEK